MAERIEALEKAAFAFPDNAHVLYKLGDTYFHFGLALGYPDGLERANAQLLGSIALDSMLASSLIHLVWYAAARGDTANVRRYGERVLRDSPNVLEDITRWRMAIATGKQTQVDRALEYLERTHQAGSVVAYNGLWDSLGMANADRLLAAATRSATTPAQRLNVGLATARVERNRGRPRAAHVAVSGPDFGHDVNAVYERLYGDGDSASASAVMEVLEPIADAPLATVVTDRLRQYEAICAVEQWRLWAGHPETVSRAIEILSNPVAPPQLFTRRDVAQRSDEEIVVEEARLCSTALTALRAVRDKRADAAAAVVMLDSAVWAGDNISSLNLGSVVQNDRARRTILLARLHEMLGDTQGALRTIRRRCQVFSYPHGELLSASLREEGRLASLAGDRSGAIKAYRWYLTLVTNPEPAIIPTRDRVRADLRKLEQRRAIDRSAFAARGY
jgi:hypothetical protein